MQLRSKVLSMTLPKQAVISRAAVGTANNSLSGKHCATFSSRSSNQMSRIFSDMKTSCAEEMKAYAVCVSKNHQEGTLKQKSCDVEFNQVKNCFHVIRSPNHNGNLWTLHSIDLWWKNQFGDIALPLPFQSNIRTYVCSCTRKSSIFVSLFHFKVPRDFARYQRDFLWWIASFV